MTQSIKDRKIAMVYSKKYKYYQFPSGGIETGESMEDALIREVSEETGLCVIRNSIQEYRQLAIAVNRETMRDDFSQVMPEPEARVLELLLQEGYFE